MTICFQRLKRNTNTIQLTSHMSKLRSQLEKSKTRFHEIHEPYLKFQANVAANRLRHLQRHMAHVQ